MGAQHPWLFDVIPELGPPTIEFTIPGTIESYKPGRAVPYLDDNGKLCARIIADPRNKAVSRELYLKCLRWRPRDPWPGPVRLQLTLFYEACAKPRWRREAQLAGTYYKVGRPDCDNVMKMVGDTLEMGKHHEGRGFWVNDSQIIGPGPIKRYGERNEVNFRMWFLKQAESPRKAIGGKNDGDHTEGWLGESDG